MCPTRATFASSLCATTAIDSPTTATSEQSSEVSTQALFAPSFGINARISFRKLISKICSRTHNTREISMLQAHSYVAAFNYLCRIYGFAITSRSGTPLPAAVPKSSSQCLGNLLLLEWKSALRSDSEWGVCARAKGRRWFCKMRSLATLLLMSLENLWPIKRPISKASLHGPTSNISSLSLSTLQLPILLWLLC